MKIPKAIVAAALMAGLLSPLLLADKQKIENQDARFYPLAFGNVWTYEVTSLKYDVGWGNDPEMSRSSVTWTVTHSSVQREWTVFQVWPKPMQSDDEAMQLAVTPQGILETTDDTLVLRFPITVGDRWTQTPRGSMHSRMYYVRSAKQPCEVGEFHIPSCVVVEEDDPDTHLKTVTTYGRDIGPVRYQYYGQRHGEEVLVQNVSLTAHRLAAR